MRLNLRKHANSITNVAVLKWSQDATVGLETQRTSKKSIKQKKKGIYLFLIVTKKTVIING